MPTEGDPDGASIRAFHNMVAGAIQGIKKR
jgi:hypothetical protein